MPHEEDSQLDRSPLHLIHRALQVAEDVFKLEMSALDLTPRQYAILVAVSKNEGVRQTDLTEMTGTDRSTMADLVRRLIQKRLLLRQRSKEDRRAYAIKLTERGWLALKHAQPVAERVDDKLLAALPKSRANEFLASLSILIEVWTSGKLRRSEKERSNAESSV